jgi:hypothetical protein
MIFVLPAHILRLIIAPRSRPKFWWGEGQYPLPTNAMIHTSTLAQATARRACPGQSKRPSPPNAL